MITRKSHRSLDFYPTDPRWLAPLMSRESFEGTITEPCCGDGALTAPLMAAGFRVEHSDIADFGGNKIQDAFDLTSADNVITNPPYIIAEDLITHWLRTTSNKVSVLMRIGFLESARRSDLFRGNPPKSLILIPVRMKVFGKASQFPHVWVTWDNSIRNKETLFYWASPEEVGK